VLWDCYYYYYYYAVFNAPYVCQSMTKSQAWETGELWIRRGVIERLQFLFITSNQYIFHRCWSDVARALYTQLWGETLVTAGMLLLWLLGGHLTCECCPFIQKCHFWQIMVLVQPGLSASAAVMLCECGVNLLSC